MDRVTEITESVFNALAQIQRMDSAPMPELLHQKLSMYIEQATRAAGKLGFSQQDTDDIKFAMVALIDQVMLSKDGQLREFWLPRMLELRFFNTNVAGDAFFDRLETLRGDTSRIDALKVYYLCLMFGFRGKYGIRGGELELADMTDRLRDELIKAKAITSETSLSPQGPRPYEAIADGRRNLLLVWLSIAAAVSSVLLYVGLRLSLMNQADRLVERLVGIVGG